VPFAHKFPTERRRRGRDTSRSKPQTKLRKDSITVCEDPARSYRYRETFRGFRVRKSQEG
jgi:hypothetical protein